jgi:spore germination protein YaaH
MDRKNVLYLSCLVLIITACSPPAQAALVTPTPTLTLSPEETKTATITVTLPGLIETPLASFTPPPGVVEERTEMTYHVVQTGETTRDIAEHYHLSESSIIFSNFELLPNALSPGMTLIIPPVDGFYYMMKEGEDLPEVAHRFRVSIISILGWPENGLDPEIEDIEPGKIIFVPDGKNPHFEWSTATPSSETAP